MPALLRVILARLVGSVVAALVTWLASKGFDVPTKVTEELVTEIVTVLLTVFSIVYGLVHTAISAKINPKDVSSPTAAELTAKRGY
jgi:cation transporter-like permease